MSEGVLEERIKKSFALMKSKGEPKGMRFCNFYFDYYLGYEKLDLHSSEKYSYTQVFDKLMEDNLLEEIGCIWRIK